MSEQLTSISEITGLPMVSALQESCGEDSCADACEQYGEQKCAGCPVQKAISQLHDYSTIGTVEDFENYKQSIALVVSILECYEQVASQQRRNVDASNWMSARFLILDALAGKKDKLEKTLAEFKKRIW